MQELIDLDKRLLLFLNGFHHPVLDTVMIWATETFIWLPLYLFFIFLIFKKYKQQGWYILLGAALTILLANEITSTLMKPFFARLRPSHEPGLKDLVHLVDGYVGGLYGFASSHAANTFGIALFMWLAIKPFYRWIGWVFLWAALMTYTRIYLGVHYPGDIIVGALVGLASGWASFRFSNWLRTRFTKEEVTSK